MAKKRQKKRTQSTSPKQREPRVKAKNASPAEAASNIRQVHLHAMAARHRVTRLTGKVKRPEFVQTTDLRATSDLLWSQLETFRRRLMEGGVFTPAQWQQAILDIRELACECRLLPSPESWKWIACMMREVGVDGPCAPDESASALEMCFVCPGEGGLIFNTDLINGFTRSEGGYSTRECAISWAEGWMKARERQLVSPASSNAAPRVADPSIENQGPVLKPNGWTRGDLIDQARGASPRFSGGTFDAVRRRANIDPARRGGGGAQRRFSNAQLRKLIEALREGTFRYKVEIAQSWECLLPRD